MEIRSGDKPKIIVILGPTSSGKTSLSIKVAKKFNGEIVSADSRQVYKGMDVGTGKVTEEEAQGIAHHLIDIASPKRNFSAGKYKKAAEKAISDIIKRDKIPIVCGGTAFYIKILVDGIVLPKVKPDSKLRRELEKESPKYLFEYLKSIDPLRANEIEQNNPRRLIRAIEIVTKSGSPVPPIKKDSKFNSIKIGINKDPKELNNLIKKRLKSRLKQGMIEETQRLKDSGISWKRLDGFGLEYRWTSRYLRGKVSYQEMFDALLRDIIKFSKKQMIWFNYDKDIIWIKNYREAIPEIDSFLQKKERKSSLL
ncbi:MAG: tRNA (adenosine(37)-N6)-dimethylallyltransferase MiaA [Minisyncoccales bacterium]|jgi:tRNA dimethylallyltransferase